LFGKKIVLFHIGKDTVSFSFNQEFRKNNLCLNSITNYEWRNAMWRDAMWRDAKIAYKSRGIVK
jgi:hypothetical protein